MVVRTPGHAYDLASYDEDHNPNTLVFMQRMGPGYPGNKGVHGGTNIQEVLRVLIDRIQYLENQIPHYTNCQVLYNLRDSLNLLEIRAAERHSIIYPHPDYEGIENLKVCSKCGHIVCGGHNERN